MAGASPKRDTAARRPRGAVDQQAERSGAPLEAGICFFAPDDTAQPGPQAIAAAQNLHVRGRDEIEYILEPAGVTQFRSERRLYRAGVARDVRPPGIDRRQ